MIKFGIPVMDSKEDLFPNDAVLTIQSSVEGSKTRKKLSLNRKACEELKVVPGISKIAFSFDGGNFLAVVPNGTEGIPESEKIPVNKEMSFMSKKAHDFITSLFKLDVNTTTHLKINNIEEKYGLIIGSFDGTKLNTEIEDTTTILNEQNKELL